MINGEITLANLTFNSNEDQNLKKLSFFKQILNQIFC